MSTVLSIRVAALPWNDMKHKRKENPTYLNLERGICFEVLDLVLVFVKLFLFIIFFKRNLKFSDGKDPTNLQLQTLDTSAIKQYKRAIYPILKAQRFYQVRQWWWCHSLCCPSFWAWQEILSGLILKEVPVLGNSETSCCILFQ